MPLRLVAGQQTAAGLDHAVAELCLMMRQRRPGQVFRRAGLYRSRQGDERARVRDAMLGLAPVPAEVPPGWLRTGLAGALTDFRDCRYGRLADGLPPLICGGHAIAAQAGDDPEASAVLAGIYTLATRAPRPPARPGPPGGAPGPDLPQTLVAARGL
jgi:hypothetical protein